MATRLKPVDVVTVGVGWAGSILGKELAQAGLKVVGLERGDNRTQADFALPQTHDQYKYDRQLELFEQTSRSTLTFRNDSVEREVCSDRKSTRLNSSHLVISYAVFCLK